MEDASHSIPIGLQTLLSDLNFLSQIKRDTKPCCDSKILISSTSWGGAIYRYFKGENRNNVVSQVEKIVAHTIDAIESYKNTDHIKIIVNYFSEAREGIAALLIVYSTDPNITAKIKVQIDLIDIHLKHFRKLIKGYAEKSMEFSDLNPAVPKDSKDIDDHNKEEEFPGLNSNLTSNSNLNSNSASIDLFDSSETEKRKFRRNKIKVSEKIA